MADRRALAAAVVGFVAVATAPLAGISVAGQYALATAAFAGALWVTGGLPLPITAVTVPFLLLAFGVVPDAEAALAGFADPVVALLFAGFVLAEALRKHGTDRRIAYRVLAAVGTSPRRIVLAVMVATAALSMVISNTATTAMMVPVALGIADRVESEGARPDATAVGDEHEDRTEADASGRTFGSRCFWGSRTPPASAASGRSSGRRPTLSWSPSSPSGSTTPSPSSTGSRSASRSSRWACR